MIDPAKTCLFTPPELAKFKKELFARVAQHVGCVETDDKKLKDLPHDIVPIVGCTPRLRPLIDQWQASKRPWLYWDRGYARRVFATWLPRGNDGGYYRWHLNAYQQGAIYPNTPGDRWKALNIDVKPWCTEGD